MIKKEDNIRSESFYPDSSFYIDNKENDFSDKGNTPKETMLLKDKIDEGTKLVTFIPELKIW